MIVKADLRILFIGASKFGFKVLDKISKTKNTNLVGIISAPQNFRISYSKQKVRNFLFHNFESFSKEKKIPFALLKNKMDDDDLFSFAKESKPDIIIVAGWYHMITKKWRDLAHCYGLHASLLPKYSGGAPLVWAMINNEKETGISFFEMDSGVDTGKIVSQKKVEIASNETIQTLYVKIENLALKIISETLPMFYEGKVTFKDQDHSKRTTYPQRNPSDGKIDWNKKSEFIERFIRAQTKPYPGAFTIVKGKEIRIWKAKISREKFEDTSPGKLVIRNESIYFTTKDGSIEVLEHEAGI